MHLAGGVSARHFLVHDARPGGHPLDRARPQQAAIAQAVAVFDLAFQDVGYGLDAAMRMPGKALGIRGRVVVAEIVQQQKRIALARIAEAKDAVQVDAGALHGRLRAGF
ncbi:MAG: hypothetical protein AAGE76_07740 [Pseudomonadota bacterium]